MYVPSQSIDTMNVAEDATNATFISSKNLLFMLGSVYFVYHRQRKHLLCHRILHHCILPTGG
jgi:hypothetical protein